MKHLPLLVILIPLCGALLCPLLGKLSRNAGKRAVICTLFAAAVCAALQLVQVVRGGAALHYWLGGWKPPYGIEFVIDGINAPIILLDEATASLDVDNETVIQESLSKLIRNKTVMIIAHRMRTVAEADKIVVLKDGVVAEIGMPKELEEKGGIYQHMAAVQMQAAGWQL